MQHAIEALVITVALTLQGAELRSDAQALAQPQGLATLVVGGVAAMAASSTHDRWYDDLRGSWLLERPSDVTDVYGSSSLNLPITFGLWGGGRLLGHSAMARLGSGLTRTLALTQMIVAPIKLGVRRQRPDRSNRLSFPSGHTASTFAMARYVQRQYGGRPSVPLYGLAVVTGAGRMEGNRHYLSDVLMGAAVGITVGNVTGTPRGDRFRVTPTPGGVRARLRF